MKSKIFLFLSLLILTVGMSINVFASENDYIVILKEEYASDSFVLSYLEPVIVEKRIYVLKERSDAEFIKQYVEYIEENKLIQVDFAEPDPVLFTQANDSYYYKQWNHTMINVDASRNIENYGEGIRVAVIDSGCNPHPDLVDNIAEGKEYISGTFINSGNDYINYTTDVTDNHGHGTHVSGIIAASMNNMGICGVAPKVEIVPLKCFDENESSTTLGLLHAICDAVTEFDCQVINMSWGISYDNSLIRQGIDYAFGEGVILVASSGNAENGESPAAIAYPAYYDNVISVASLTSSGERASYSYYNAGVTVAAPGSSIYSTHKAGGYVNMSGTSQAAPHVVGVAALALSLKPDMTNTEFIEILTSTCVDKGEPGRDDYYGYGLVDVGAMIEKIMEDIPLYISPMHQNGTTSCFHIRNNTDTPLVATNIFAKYDDKTLVDMTSTDLNLQKGEGITVPVDFEYSKHFVWKSFEKPEPMEDLRARIQKAIMEE